MYPPAIAESAVTGGVHSSSCATGTLDAIVPVHCWLLLTLQELRQLNDGYRARLDELDLQLQAAEASKQETAAEHVQQLKDLEAQVSHRQCTLHRLPSAPHIGLCKLQSSFVRSGIGEQLSCSCNAHVQPRVKALDLQLLVGFSVLLWLGVGQTALEKCVMVML